MLQRIQSIYLLLASLAIFALFLFPFVHSVYVNGVPVSISVTGVFQDTGGQQTHIQFFTTLTIVTAVIAMVPLFIIFLFKNRRRQLMLCYVAILLIIADSYWMTQTVKEVMGSIQIDTHNWGIGMFLTPLSILFILFAIKGIQRDEKLVKSADRLR
jgi:hypothetical protein